MFYAKIFPMNNTIELYYKSAYIKEFDAKVISCLEGKNGKYEVVLDKTAFFPEQGGQSSDIGSLTDEGGKEYKVTHTAISSSEGMVRHITDAPIAEGCVIHGCIDWNHRFSNMQQHTGEHIFSGIVHSRFGFENVGFHLSDSEVTMDYSGVLTEEDIREIELEVNKAIWANIEVICEFPDADRLATIDFRSKKELSGDVRIVTIPGYDVCACCAPHVLKTGEIGLLKVVGLQNYKGGVRVNILCGQRALEYVDSQQNIIKELVNIFTTSESKIVDSVKKLSDENSSSKQKLAEAMDELVGYELKEIDPSKEDVFLIKPSTYDGNTMRKMVNELSKTHGGYCGIFAGDGVDNYRYIISTGCIGKELKAIQNLLGNEFAARGGGNAKMIQGSIEKLDVQELLKKLEQL